MAATNEFSALARTVSQPASDFFTVTPSDTTDLQKMTKALWMPMSATAGTVVVITEAGTTRTTYLAPGDLLPVRVVRVLATGTAAVGLVALV